MVVPGQRGVGRPGNANVPNLIFVFWIDGIGYPIDTCTGSGSSTDYAPVVIIVGVDIAGANDPRAGSPILVFEFEFLDSECEQAFIDVIVIVVLVLVGRMVGVFLDAETGGRSHMVMDGIVVVVVLDGLGLDLLERN